MEHEGKAVGTDNGHAAVNTNANQGSVNISAADGSDEVAAVPWYLEEQQDYPELARIRRAITSDEENTVLHSTLTATSAGFVFGGLISAKFEADRWKAKNADTRFKSQFQAQRQLNDVILKHFALRGCYWGARIGFFAGIYSLLNLGIEKYRGEKDVGNYVAAAGASGAIAGLTKGPKAAAQGMLAAGICGLAFGSMIGGLEYVQGSMKDEQQQQQQQQQQSSGGSGGSGGSGSSGSGSNNNTGAGGIGSNAPAKPWAETVRRQEEEASTGSK